MMLDEHRAYAFGEQEVRLFKILAGDIVFLYHNKRGICAVGIAKERAIHSRRTFLGQSAYFVPLESFQSVDPVEESNRCYHFREMCKALGRKVGVRSTRFRLSNADGRKLLRRFRSRYDKTASI